MERGVQGASILVGSQGGRERKTDRLKMRQPPERASLLMRRKQAGDQNYKFKMTVFPSTLCLACCML